MSQSAVFLDRDGVINPLVSTPIPGETDSPYSVDEFTLLPRVGEAIRMINETGLLAVVVSNQPGIAKGKCSSDTLNAITDHMHELIAREGGHLDHVYYCLHHPEGIREPLRVVCACRKPSPGLLLQAAQEMDIDLQRSYMVGDRSVDVEAGMAAGCRTIIVSSENVDTAHLYPTETHSWAPDLFASVALIQSHEKGH